MKPSLLATCIVIGTAVLAQPESERGSGEVPAETAAPYTRVFYENGLRWERGLFDRELTSDVLVFS